jgi:alpha-N-acetylglucosamine transferase
MPKYNRLEKRRWLALLGMFIATFFYFWGLGLQQSISYLPEALRKDMGAYNKRRCAYVFYAANDGYACSAIVNMMRLRRLGEGLPSDVDLILIASDGLSKEIRHVAIETAQAYVYNATSFPAQLPQPLGHMSGYYNESGNKFLAFLLPTTIYRRLILLDADCLILRAPHHLFELPDEIPYAAPKAYWYWKKRKFQDSAFWKVRSLRRSRQDFLTSWFMTVG